jgi:hypothetical protein
MGPVKKKNPTPAKGDPCKGPVSNVHQTGGMGPSTRRASRVWRARTTFHREGVGSSLPPAIDGWF